MAEKRKPLIWTSLHVIYILQACDGSYESYHHPKLLSIEIKVDNQAKVPMLLKVQQQTPVYYDDDDYAEVQDAKQPDMEYI